MLRYQIYLCLFLANVVLAEDMLRPKMVVPPRRGPASLRDADKKPKPKRSLRAPSNEDDEERPSDLDPEDGAKPVRVTEDPEYPSEASRPTKLSTSSLNIAVTANLASKYYEEETPPPLNGEEGILPGVNLDIAAFISGRWMLRALMDFYVGKTQYFGALTNGTPISSPTDVVILDLSAYAGVALFQTPTYRLTPYIGFGHRYWNRGLTGVGAYLERYYFYYLPMGVRYDSVLSENFNLTIDASFMLNLGGTIDVFFSQLVPPQQDVTGTLGKSSGIAVQAPIDYKMSENFTLRAVPFFQLFGIGKGDDFTTRDANGNPTGTAYEPASTTTLYGVRLGGTYTF